MATITVGAEVAALITVGPVAAIAAGDLRSVLSVFDPSCPNLILAAA
jgi:hypothetical protein